MSVSSLSLIPAELFYSKDPGLWVRLREAVLAGNVPEARIAINEIIRQNGLLSFIYDGESISIFEYCVKTDSWEFFQVALERIYSPENLSRRHYVAWHIEGRVFNGPILDFARAEGKEAQVAELLRPYLGA